MFPKVILVDINPKMIEAWKSSFEENPEVKIVQGSILDQASSAWVSPTNSRGLMRGGIDAVIKNHLGGRIETRVQQEINKQYLGVMPIGCAVCVPTDMTAPKVIIAAPTMGPSQDNIGDTFNVALATAAALHAAVVLNRATPGSIDSIAFPGMGTSSGGVPVEICADLMWSSWNMMRTREFPDFFSLRGALEELLGDLGSMSAKKKLRSAKTPPAIPAAKPQAAPAVPLAAPPVIAKPQAAQGRADIDFDDAE